MSTTHSVLTPIRVHTSVIRKVLDVHAEMQPLVAAIERATATMRRVIAGAEWAAAEAEVERCEAALEELALEELEALRAYYMATAQAMGIDVTRPGDMAARLESTLRVAAGGGL